MCSKLAKLPKHFLSLDCLLSVSPDEQQNLPQQAFFCIFNSCSMKSCCQRWGSDTCGRAEDPPVLCSFPPSWGTQCITQALRRGVVHRSGDNVPGNRRRHRNGVGAGSSLSGASPREALGWYGPCSSIPGWLRCTHISAQ